MKTRYVLLIAVMSLLGFSAAVPAMERCNQRPKPPHQPGPKPSPSPSPSPSPTPPTN